MPHLNPDLLALRFMDLQGLPLFAVIYALLILGGALGGLTTRGDATLDRPRYFLGLGILAFLLGVNQAWYLFWMQAVVAGYGWAPVAAEVAGTMLIGALLARMAKARSRDMVGHARRAWQGFMPPLGFWLLAKTRPDGLWSPSNLPLLAVGLVLMFIGRLMGGQLDHEAEQRTRAQMQDPAVIQAYVDMYRRSGLIQSELEAKIATTDLPFLMGNGFILSALTRDDLTLTYHFTFDPAAPGASDPVTAADMTTYYCTAHAAQISLGATVQLTFTGDKSPLTAPQTRTAETCAA